MPFKICPAELALWRNTVRHIANFNHMINLKFYFIIAALVASLGALAWFHISSVQEGKRLCEIAQMRQAQKQQDYDNVQADKIITDLRRQLNELASTPAPGPIRLCVKSPMPVRTTPPSTQPAAATVRDSGEVPSGVTAGPDISTQLSDIASLASVASDFDRACVAWGLRGTHP